MSPLSLSSFQPARWTLLVLGHGRWEYAFRALDQVAEVVGLDKFDRLVFSHDGPGTGGIKAPDGRDFEVLSTGERKGLTANLTQAWDALGDDEWVLHVEEDFLIHDAPLDAMRAVLEANPTVCQMVLERQPIHPAEHAAGGLLGGQCIPTWEERNANGQAWREQRHLFSFNPCVYRSDIATVAGTETVVTERLRGEGRTFGFWGAQGDAPRVEHIGVQGGMGSAGWAA